jgi:hypothetical protein
MPRIQSSTHCLSSRQSYEQSVYGHQLPSNNISSPQQSAFLPARCPRMSDNDYQQMLDTHFQMEEKVRAIREARAKASRERRDRLRAESMQQEVTIVSNQQRDLEKELYAARCRAYVEETNAMFEQAKKDLVVSKINWAEQAIKGMVNYDDSERIKLVQEAIRARDALSIQEEEDIEYIAQEETDASLFPICPITKDLIHNPVCNSVCKHIFERSTFAHGTFKYSAKGVDCPHCGKVIAVSKMCKDVEMADKIEQWTKQGIYTKEYMLQCKKQTQSRKLPKQKQQLVIETIEID